MQIHMLYRLIYSILSIQFDFHLIFKKIYLNEVLLNLVARNPKIVRLDFNYTLSINKSHLIKVPVDKLL